MRTQLAQTSIAAFYSFRVPELKNKEMEVLAAIKEAGRPKTREQIAQMLGWKESAVCGRVNSLVAKCVLEESGTVKTSSGRSAKLVGLPVRGQRSLF
jgi:predicted transcriptional regulator